MSVRVFGVVRKDYARRVMRSIAQLLNNVMCRRRVRMGSARHNLPYQTVFFAMMGMI